MTKSIGTKNVVDLIVQGESVAEPWEIMRGVDPISVWDVFPPGIDPAGRFRLLTAHYDPDGNEIAGLVEHPLPPVGIRGALTLYDSLDASEAEMISRADALRRYIGWPTAITEYNTYDGSRGSSGDGQRVGVTKIIKNAPFRLYLKSVTVVPTIGFADAQQLQLDRFIPKTPFVTGSTTRSVYKLDDIYNETLSSHSIKLTFATTPDLIEDWNSSGFGREDLVLFRIHQLFFLTRPGGSYRFDGKNRTQPTWPTVGNPIIFIPGENSILKATFILNSIEQSDSIVLATGQTLVAATETLRGVLQIPATTNLGIGSNTIFNGARYRVNRSRVLGANAVEMTMIRELF